MKLLKRLRYRLPKYKEDIWYNRSVWMSNKTYPLVFDDNQKYINCEVGLEVLMGITKSGLGIYYEVIKVFKTRGSDFIHPSDAINCDLKFKDVRKLR